MPHTEQSWEVGSNRPIFPKFRYRYRGLRLLAQSNGRVFLIPDQWAPGNGNCLMLPVDSDTRFQFQAG
ncbi:hypothetical protein OG607_16590 [Streptomyces sp. NBC_01537]|uniref:hypothetical protein n=1 Tax=Streptomyces sp. NBC_01537 TaxID=2903896 RepID=UPI00386FD2AC